jgi:hypothetical protein
MPIYGRSSNYTQRSWRRINMHLAVQLIGQRDAPRKPAAKAQATGAYRRRRLRPGILLDIRV